MTLYQIRRLGACNPHCAYKTIQVEDKIGFPYLVNSLLTNMKIEKLKYLQFTLSPQ
jgi:hypothetical protein